MKVWAATWEIKGTETGFEVFAEESLAVEAAIGYAQEMSLLDDEGLTVNDARQILRSEGKLNFYDSQCCYGVFEHDVIERT